MGLRFTEEPTTAVYEFEKMTDEEMDEIFYTHDEIGDFRHSAFMIECGLEEEDWSAPDVEPLPWPKEIDENKIKKFESNLALLKEKRKKQLAEIAANADLSPSSSNTADSAETETKPLEDESKPEPAAIEDPVKVEPLEPENSGTLVESKEDLELKEDLGSTTLDEKIKAHDSKSLIEESSRTAATEDMTSSTDDASFSIPASPYALKVKKSVAKADTTIESPLKSNDMLSPTRNMVSPRRRSFSMDTRSKDKKALDNILKAFESPKAASPKKAAAPTTVSPPKRSPSTGTEPKSKETEEPQTKPANSLAAMPRYTTPLGGGETTNKSSWMPPMRGISRANSLNKGSKKNRSKILASLDASIDGGLPESPVPMPGKLKPTKSADLEHMFTTADEEDEKEKGERKQKRGLMRTNSGSLSKVRRKPRKGKKGETNDEESASKPVRRMKKGRLEDSISNIGGEEEEGSKKKKRSSLSKKPSKRGDLLQGSISNIGEDEEGSKMKKRGSLSKKSSKRDLAGDNESDTKPKKRSSLKKEPSMRRTDSGVSLSSTGSSSKKLPSLKKQGSSKRMSGESSKKKRPSLNRSNSTASASSTGSKSKKKSSSDERRPRRGMKKEVSLRMKGFENSISEISVEMSDERKPRKALRKSFDNSISELSVDMLDQKPAKSKKKSKKALKIQDKDDSSMSEDDLKDPNLLSPIREPKSSKKRGKSLERGSFHSIGMSSVSSGVSFLGSIDDNSVGSDQSIETVDDDELFDIPKRSADTDDDDDESENEMQEEFFRYMKAQPKDSRSGVKVYTVYHEKKSSVNGKLVANRDFVCTALVMT